MCIHFAVFYQAAQSDWYMLITLLETFCNIEILSRILGYDYRRGLDWMTEFIALIHSTTNNYSATANLHNL
jgi:hypothetical protein